MTDLIFNVDFHEKINAEPFVIIDIGARGEFQEPWKTLNHYNKAPLKVVGFEPDAAECASLQDKYGDPHVVLPTALWDKKGDVTFYLDGGRSSIHGPNLDYLKSFEERNWKNRTDFKKITVACDTLDNVCQEQAVTPDFIKCDTQGSEFEILNGAKKILKSSVFGVVAETWTIEAHKGQRLGFEVERQCHEAGLELFLRQPRGLWKRQATDGMMQRCQETQHDSLFFKRPADLFAMKSVTPYKVMKLAALAEYYGFTGYACEVLTKAMDHFPDHTSDMKWCMNEIEQNNRHCKGSTLLGSVMHRIDKVKKYLTPANMNREL